MNAIALEPIDRTNDHYEEFLLHIQSRFSQVVGAGRPLFTTNAEGLFDALLNFLPMAARQHYTCHACRHFVERFGGLVALSEDGRAISAIWDASTAPEFFQASAREMERIIAKATVTGVFLSAATVWGTPTTGEWNHFYVAPPKNMIYNSHTLTAGQRMAEKLEDFKMLIAGLLEFSAEAVAQAITLLKTESLYRSEKCLGVAEWLKTLHDRRAVTKNSVVKQNLVWLAVATAPAGFCHVRSSMIGTLLEDILAGLSFAAVSKRFADKMHPLQYQRPQAAPSAGNIAQAEKIMAELGAAGALARRFARLDELQTIWKPANKPQQPAAGNGVFSHLAPKNQPPEVPALAMPPVLITWDKFLKTVISTARQIEFHVPPVPSNYAAILTAVNQDAPPIIQWDSGEHRNPFSWYVYNGGSSPSQWGLQPGYCNVTGVCLQPSMWGGSFDHQGKSVIFILEGARDARYENSGAGLFPEILKSEFHSIRATIEAYSRRATAEGYDEASACGIRLQAGASWDALFRITSEHGRAVYRLDRWD